MKTKKPINLKTWLIPKLRRLSYQWPNRNEAKQLARIARGKYKCATCNNIFGPSAVVLDHINPVVNPDAGWEGFGKYVESLFCNTEGFQVLCYECHNKKTDAENVIRKENKKA